MVMAVVAHDQGADVLDALINAGHRATFSESRGGMLRQSQLMIWTAVDTAKLEEVLSIIREHCSAQVRACTEESEGGLTPEGMPVTALLGGAAVFVWPLDSFETC